GGIRTDVDVAGRTHTEKWTALLQLGSDTYASVLRIPFVKGRPFTEAEVDDARKVTVVNQTFVGKYLGSDDPLGQRIHVAQLQEFPDKVDDPWFEVVGVAADSKNQGLQEPVLPEVWVPYTVTGSAGRGLLPRTGP